jgi:hypothetical protein
VKRGLSVIAASWWGPYVVAGTFLLIDYLWLARSLSYRVGPGGYGTWSLNRAIYDDVIKLMLDHYVRGGHFIHPLPYIHDRIEYPILLGFTLWLPTWLPGGLSAWFGATGVLTAIALFGSIALIRRQHPASVWWLAASPALLLDGAINWDLIGIVFLVGAVVWFGERRYGLSGAATAVGTWFKLFPVIVAPMALAVLGSRWWRAKGQHSAERGESGGSESRDLARWLVPFVAVSVAVVVPFLVLAPSNTLWFIRFNSLRAQKDSIWEIPMKIFGASVISNHLVNTLSLLVVAVTIAYGMWTIWRTPTASQFRAMTLATALVMIVWMTVNKIWNPQYVLWIFVVGALCAMPARFGVALGGLSVFDYLFEFVLRRPDTVNPYAWVGWIVVVAHVALYVVMIKWTVDELRGDEPAPDNTLPAENRAHSTA